MKKPKLNSSVHSQVVISPANRSMTQEQEGGPFSMFNQKHYQTTIGQ
jgi:hypothetical protein